MDGKIYLQAESGMLEKTGFKGRQIGLKPVFLTAGKERTFTFVLVEKNGTVTDGQKKALSAGNLVYSSECGILPQPFWKL